MRAIVTIGPTTPVIRKLMPLIERDANYSLELRERNQEDSRVMQSHLDIKKDVQWVGCFYFCSLSPLHFMCEF